MLLTRLFSPRYPNLPRFPSVPQSKTRHPQDPDRRLSAKVPGCHHGLGILALYFLLSTTLWAHPHAWIDLRIIVQTNADGHITGLSQEWFLDPIYSRYLYDDALAQFEGATPEDKLQALADEILENLEEYAWYTEFAAGSQALAAAPQGGATLQFDAEKRLRFSFVLNLADPINPAQETFHYAIFDPTYFVEVLHHPDFPPSLDRERPECTFKVVQPRPDPVIVARALALDFTQTGDTDLGRHFAQRVSVSCQ